MGNQSPRLDSKDYSPASEPAIDWPDSDLPPSDPPAESGDDTPLAEPRTPILARLPRNCTPTKNAPLYMKKALERRKDLDNISIVPAPQVVQEPMNILTVSIAPYIMLQVSDKARRISDKARRIHPPIQHETQKKQKAVSTVSGLCCTITVPDKMELEGNTHR